MRPDEFLKTIYIGDRYCLGYCVDSEKKTVSLRANVISRIRDPSGNWNYYDREDIIRGAIVFSGVTSFELSPPGYLPNDSINSLTATPAHGDVWQFEVHLCSVGDDARSVDLVMRVLGSHVHLEDPGRPETPVCE